MKGSLRFTKKAYFLPTLSTSGFSPAAVQKFCDTDIPIEDNAKGFDVGDGWGFHCEQNLKLFLFVDGFRRKYLSGGRQGFPAIAFSITHNLSEIARQ